MKYQELLDYIYRRHSGNVKLGLDRMLNILAAMNTPNTKLRGFHIAGTNGKGSTAAMLEAMTLAHGLTTGLNTSPHLVDYRERIRVNGTNISLEELGALYKEWQQVFEANEASFFEITTGMAFWHFFQKEVDTSIFEVGLGGRLDGTNPFASTICAITSIAYDHTKSLGNSLEKIATEKAGIIKDDTPLVLGDIPDAALDVILPIAKKHNAPVMCYGNNFGAGNIELTEDGTRFTYYDCQCKHSITTNLLGKHQAHNAAVAIAAFKLYMNARGLAIDWDAVTNALRQVNWPGRMQILRTEPTVLIDGAHNEEGMTALVSNLKQIFPNKRILFVLAILRDKNLESIIKMVCEVSDVLYISKNESTRAAEIEDQANIASRFATPYKTIPHVVDAAKAAIAEANADDLVVISGSLYTISEVLKVIDEL
ncbi:MAG: bifunctional folylpolyglutamate synthase/dihydrofolate synthase [Candidatus Cloacimonetes bacterium]|nr:bifunctional folylpolyglutamate synthase/dihydrofolate synthase [Candidatus Cloacimonadota bacterium]